jgi:hypothetical protein
MSFIRCNMSGLAIGFVLFCAAIVVPFCGQSAPAGDATAIARTDEQEEKTGASPESQLEGFRVVHLLPWEIPFGEGESFVFAIQYGLIYAGDATLEIRNIASLDSTRAYHITSTARTNSTFDLIFKVRDRVDSFMDYYGLYSDRFEKHLREGKFSRDEKVEFDQKHHLALYPDKKVPIPPDTQDFLSAVYYMRTLPLDVGMAVALPNHTSGKNYPIYVKILRRERVKVPAGTFDCLVAEPVLETATIFQHKGKLTIWFTDDSLKMPVMLRSKVVIGAFEAVLKKYTLTRETREFVPEKAGQTGGK